MGRAEFGGVAAIGTGEAFARGRDLATWLELVPRQASTGGKPRAHASILLVSNDRSSGGSEVASVVDRAGSGSRDFSDISPEHRCARWLEP
jgi:hypothetical protein